MNFCSNCGTTIGEKSRYCSNCGSFLKPVEKFSLDENTSKFCNDCGSAIVKQYCPACGRYGKEIKLKTSGLNMGKLFGSVGTMPNMQQNWNTNKKPNRTSQQQQTGYVKVLFSSLLSPKEDLKSSAWNAGLFAIILA